VSFGVCGYNKANGGVDGFVRLPSSIGLLTNLLHLMITACHQLDWPEAIGNLISLQSLTIEYVC